MHNKIFHIRVQCKDNNEMSRFRMNDLSLKQKTFSVNSFKYFLFYSRMESTTSYSFISLPSNVQKIQITQLQDFN